MSRFFKLDQIRYQFKNVISWSQSSIIEWMCCEDLLCSFAQYWGMATAYISKSPHIHPSDFVFEHFL
jgi:hypothetical protein